MSPTLRVDTVSMRYGIFGFLTDIDMPAIAVYIREYIGLAKRVQDRENDA